MLFRFALLAAVLCVLLGCSESAESPSPVAGSTPSAAAQEAPVTEVNALIPRDQIFGNPSRVQARISPDGTRLSWLAPRDGVLNIWVAPLDDLDAARPLTRDMGQGITQHQWAHDGEHLLYLQDRDGNENHHVYAVNVDSGAVRDLTPVADDVRAVIAGLSAERPGHVLLGLNDRNPQFFDLHLVEIASGERELALENPGFASVLADRQLVPRIGTRTLPDGSAEFELRDGDDWRTLLTVPPTDMMTSRLLAFDDSGNLVYGIDSRNRNTAALIELNLQNGALTVLGSHDRADVAEVLFDARSDQPMAIAVNFERTRWQALDDDAAAMLASLRERLSGELGFAAQSDDGRLHVVYTDDPTAPGVYYLYDRRDDSLRKLFSTRPELADDPLQPMQAFEIDARDGLPLVSYLTLPPGSDADGDGRPERPVPLVLYVHGGPWARDSYGYRPSHQWLANRGYATLSVNYRGSTGFGKDFLNAAIREFAGKMHSDLIDAVDWAIAEGITRRDDVAIMGGSYGGYATLVGMTFTPDRFACGVDVVGPSSLVTLVESFPAYWGPRLTASWFKFVGNPADESDRADMQNRSPITRVADIQAPLLIGHGANDPRVTKAEADRIVAAMAERELPVTYVNYPDEGHGFARPENRMSFFAISEAFLAECLGGRYEPVGDDFDNSSLEVLHGADDVPGLAAALEATADGVTRP